MNFFIENSVSTNMQTLKIFLIYLIFTLSAIAQNSVISGKVTDGAEPVPGATILVTDTDEGAVSDIMGNFEITNLYNKKYNLRISSIGYETQEIEIDLTEKSRIEVTIQLVSKVFQTGSVEVVGSKVQAQNDTRTSFLELKPRNAKIMAGGVEDVLRTLQALPGVLAPNDFSSQLIIRGSGPDQNLIIIDDIEIFNPYRLYGVISMFNPSAVSSVNLITGGFPSKYGDRLSAVLDVTNKEGALNTGFTGSLNASISDANLVLEGKNPFNIPGSWLVNSRRTYYDLIVGPVVKNAGLVDENTSFPNFYDVQLKLTLGSFNGHKFNITSIISADGVDVISAKNRKTPDSISVNNLTLNNVFGLSWLYSKSSKFSNKFTVSYYTNSGDADFASEVLDPSLNRDEFEEVSIDTIAPYLLGFKFKSAFTFRKTAAENKIMYLWGKNILEAGVGVDFLETLIDFKFQLEPELKAFLTSNPNFRSSISDIRDVKNSARYKFFIQNNFRLTEKLYIEPGFRLDHYEILSRTYLSPRISFSLAIDPITTLRGGFGIYFQSPGYEKLRDQNVLYNLDRASLKNVDAEKSIHYILGLERWLNSEWNIKTEVYYKDFKNLIIPQRIRGTTYYSELLPNQDPSLASSWTRPVPIPIDSITQLPINGSYGEAYGIEFMLGKMNNRKDSKLSGWISYAFAYANRIEGIESTPFRFDQRHTVNFVVNYTFSESWQLGIRWQYGSGFPISEPIGIKPRVLSLDTDGNGVPQTPVIATRKSLTNPNSEEVIFDIDYGENNKFNSRKPPYHRLDIRGTYTTFIWGFKWSFYLDIINVYNRTNVVAYDYYINKDLSIGKEINAMFPILPTLGFSVNF